MNVMVLIIAIIFIVGYATIALEHSVKINKAASALITGVLCWTVYALFTEDKEVVGEHLTGHLGEVAGILFFLMGAMTIVELIDAHDGFELITEKITTTNKKKLVWIISFITFFLSAVLDNLTTTIVIISLLSKIMSNRNERLLFAGLVVIVANAGGAWSPIGDVSTTMLWIGGQITATNIILKIILPSLVCMLVPVIIVSRMVKGDIEKSALEIETSDSLNLANKKQRNAVFWIGVGSLLFVPVFKTITHLPPYMGILLGLGLMWLITELMHSERDEEEKGLLSVNHALRKIDTPSVLFFLGILLSVAALQVTGVLGDVAGWMTDKIGNINVITITIGLLSAIVDNVPLVAAAQGMYDYPTDHYFWEFLAYCAGTGGSCLIIGSAAGVVAMGIEKIEFFWYLKKIAWLAFLGYITGAAVFILQHYLFG